MMRILRCVSKYVKDALCCQPLRRSSPVCAHSILSFCIFFSRIFAFLEGDVLLSRISRSCSAYRKQTPSVIKQSLSVFPSFLLPSDESEIMKSNSPPPTNCYQWEIFSVAAYKSELGSQAGWEEEVWPAARLPAFTAHNRAGSLRLPPSLVSGL